MRPKTLTLLGILSAIRKVIEYVEKSTTFSFPLDAGFSMPLSYLQLVAYELQFSSLLDAAAACVDPLVQMAHVVAFNAAFYSLFYEMRCIPLAPLLGETYELDRTSDLGWRFMSEHIQHLPPHILSVGVCLFVCLFVSA